MTGPLYVTLTGRTIHQINYDNINNTDLDGLRTLAIDNIMMLLPDLQD